MRKGERGLLHEMSKDRLFVLGIELTQSKERVRDLHIRQQGGDLFGIGAPGVTKAELMKDCRAVQRGQDGVIPECRMDARHGLRDMHRVGGAATGQKADRPQSLIQN